jgi:hypothetical protein
MSGFVVPTVPPASSIPAPSATGLTIPPLNWTVPEWIAAGGDVSDCTVLPAGATAPMTLAELAADVTDSKASLSLTGPTSTAPTCDAKIFLPDGGSEDYQGTLQLQAACTQILGYDGSVQWSVMTQMGATEFWRTQGGTGTGALLIADSITEPNVNAVLAAKGSGDFTFENQYGTLLKISSPNATVQDFLTIGIIESPSNGNFITLTPSGVDTNNSVAIPIPSNGNFCLRAPDGSTAQGGNYPSQGCVDLQLARTSPYQVASGFQSTIVGGSSHTANYSLATVIGGYGNTASGAFSVVIGGQNGWDKGETKKTVFGTTYFNTYGDCQRTESVFSGETAGPASIRLTSDGKAPSAISGLRNVFNLQNYETRFLEISLICRTRGVAGNWYSWIGKGVLSMDANPLTTTWTPIGSPTITYAGTGSGIMVSQSADTTIGGINSTVTPPTGNSVQWDFAQYIKAVEVE